MSSQNPRKWRFTWEAQSHSSTLRLYLFDSLTKPSTKCRNLFVLLNLAESNLSISWLDDDAGEVSLRVPIPRVLVDSDSPVSFRALEDHIEVKLVLLLPVDHPLFSSFDSVLDLDEERIAPSDAASPLLVDSDLKSLSSMQAEGLHFYCRSCLTRLTKKPLRNFREMPSIDWTEVADNWFGGCCCSFGGASEKLVTKYAKSYTCKEGVCLLNTTTITLSQDDLVAAEFFDVKEYQPERDTAGENSSCEAALTSQISCTEVIRFSCGSGTRDDFSKKPRLIDLKDDNLAEHVQCTEDETCFHESHHDAPTKSIDENVPSVSDCCVHGKENIDGQKDVSVGNMTKLMADQKLFLNGFLGNAFMPRSSNLSTDIRWIEFLCPHCVSPLGAYPVCSGVSPVDGGVRLFKCCISTSVPARVSDNLFRKYTLERMVTNQLSYAAQDELSFRTLVRDLATRSPILQIVVLNLNAWCCSGYCLDTVGCSTKQAMTPIVKVLFSDCRNIAESQSRLLEDWVRKNQADEVFMFQSQVDKLMECLASAREMLPPSCKSLQGLCLSSLQR